MAVRCRVDRVIANFDASLRMRPDAMAKVAGEHLRAEANAEKWFLFREGNADPLDFAANPSIAVIGAHRAAENDHPIMVRERFGKRIAEGGAANVELESSRAKKAPDPAWRRTFLMQDDKNPA
jgi:hypothetical protein